MRLRLRKKRGEVRRWQQDDRYLRVMFHELAAKIQHVCAICQRGSQDDQVRALAPQLLFNSVPVGCHMDAVTGRAQDSPFQQMGCPGIGADQEDIFVRHTWLEAKAQA